MSDFTTSTETVTTEDVISAARYQMDQASILMEAVIYGTEHDRFVARINRDAAWENWKNVSNQAPTWKFEEIAALDAAIRVGVPVHRTSDAFEEAISAYRAA